MPHNFPILPSSPNVPGSNSQSQGSRTSSSTVISTPETWEKSNETLMIITAYGQLATPKEHLTKAIPKVGFTSKSEVS